MVVGKVGVVGGDDVHFVRVTLVHWLNHGRVLAVTNIINTRCIDQKSKDWLFGFGVSHNRSFYPLYFTYSQNGCFWMYGQVLLLHGGEKAQTMER